MASAQARFWVAGGTSNWNNTANWSTTSGGAGGASVPGAANTVTFDANGNGQCNLDVIPTVAGITINGYTGVVDLAGRNLTTTGTNTFASGTVNNSGGAASLVLNTTGTTTFSGTTFGANITGTSARILFHGSTFNGTVTVTKDGNTNDIGNGGNTFNAAVSLTNTSTQYLRLGNTNPDIFNSTLSVSIGNTGDIVLAYSAAGTQFNNNVVVNYSSTGDVLVGTNGGTSTLATGRTITVGTVSGTGPGDLQLANFTQAGATAQTITMAGNSTAILTLGPSSTFNGAVTTTSPVLIFNSSTFNSTGNFTQTSNTNTGNSRGGNVFIGTCTFTNTGDADLVFGANGADPGDTFQGNATFNDLGGGRIRVSENSAGTIFNGNATFNSSGANNAANRIQISRFNGSTTTFNGTTTINNNGNSSDIHVCYDAGTLATFNGPLILNSATTAAGEFDIGRDGNVVINGSLQLNSTCTDNIEISAGNGTVTFGNGGITIGGSGFAQGQLTFRNFTQTGATGINLALTGTGRMNVGPSSAFGGNVTFTAPRIFLNGTTFNGTGYFEKNGTNDDYSNGNNVFNGTTTVVNSSGNQFILGNSGPDVFNAGVTFTNTGTSNLHVAQASPGNQFNGNIVVNNPSGNSINFSTNTNGSSTLAAGRTITIGGSGFSTGTLNLNRFTQLGATPQLLTLTGTGTLNLGPSSAFGGNVTFTAPDIILNGCIFDGTATLTKNGGTSSTGAGNNIFNGTTLITNSGSGNFRTNGTNTFNAATTLTNTGSADILLELSSGSTYNGSLTMNSLGSGYIRAGYNGANIFNGNIQVNCTAGAGVYFSENASGTSTLTATHTIVVGGTGFNTGTLNLNRFTQVGATPQAITLTGTATLNIGPASQFDGNVTFITPRLLLQGCTYNGTTYLEKNGDGYDNGSGGNTFNGTTVIVNSGVNTLNTGNVSPDTFNGNVTFSNTGTNIINVAYNSAGNIFNGNIVVNSTSGNGVNFCINASATATLANTRTISVGGLGFSSGNLRLLRFTQVGPTAQTLLLTGTTVLTVGPSSSFDGAVDFRSPQLYLNGTTYNGTAYLEKTGATDDGGTGGNIFNGTTTIVDSGSGQLRTGTNNPDIFNGPLTLTNTGTNWMFLAYNTTGNQFNNNITVNNTTGNGITFANNTGAAATLANGFTIQVGGTGFAAGELRLRNFTQLGPTAQNVTLTGTAIFRLGFNSTFNGAVDFRAPRIILDGATYNGTTYIEKTGATNDDSNGNNVFNGTTTLANSGSGYLRSAVSTLDTFNGDLSLINTGSATIRMGDVVTGTLFNGNVQVTCTNGGGIWFGDNPPGNATLAAGRTITVGAGGFTTGELRMNRFIQLGATPQALTLTGNALLTLGPGAAFGGNVTMISPSLRLDGATYSGTGYFEKTGAGNDAGTGNNIFGGATQLVNTGTGYLMSASGGPDVFNGDLTVTNSSSSIIYLAHSVAGTQFNGNILLNTTAGNGIYFSDNAAGSSTLAAGRTISIGGTGWNSGDLRIRRFTQTGGTAQTVIIPPAAATSIFVIGPSTTFNGNVNFQSPRITLDGATYNGTAYFEKTAASTDNSSGNNIFNQQTTIANSGPGDFRHGVSALDTYNADLIVANSGAGAIAMARNTAGNIFNGNIQVNSTSGNGISFGTGNGTSTLAAGRTITVGVSGFSSGTLELRNFTQTGGTAQNLTLTGTALLQVGTSSTFNGSVTFVSPQVLLQGCTYNGTAYIEKNGNSNNTSFGNNIFNGTTTIVNSGPAIFRLSNDNSGSNAGDQFNGPVTFVRTGAGALQPAYNRTSYFASDITTNDPTGITFSAGNGVAELNGGNAQSINKTIGSASPIFRRLTLNKSGNSVTLNTDVQVSIAATFTSGVINSTTANYMDFADNATATGMNDASYVDGPVRKTGNDAFTFPTGDAGFYRPVGISAPTNTAHHFTAQYFRAAQAFGTSSTFDPTFWTVSACDYWTLDRTNGASNVNVTLSWNENACGGAGYITNLPDLRVARWNGAAWVSHGNGGTTGNTSSGTVVTGAAVTSFSPFALASTTPLNPLPIELEYFRATPADNIVSIEWKTQTELDNDFFTVERSSSGFDFEPIGTVKGHGTSAAEHTYYFADENPYYGRSYYRLKQTDFDGTSQYYGIATVFIEGGDATFTVYPNPAGKEKVYLSQKANIVILNNLNQVVKRGNEVTEIDVSDLAAGVYLVRNHKGEIARLVVQ